MMDLLCQADRVVVLLVLVAQVLGGTSETILVDFHTAVVVAVVETTVGGEHMVLLE
jgi:hypothetical protein